jgi:hypothetical protein
MKYCENTKGQKQRGSKTNLTKGAFGICNSGFNQSMKVIQKHLRTNQNSNKYGVSNV